MANVSLRFRCVPPETTWRAAHGAPREVTNINTRAVTYTKRFRSRIREGGIKEGTPSNALKQQVSRLFWGCFFPLRGGPKMLRRNLQQVAAAAAAAAAAVAEPTGDRKTATISTVILSKKKKMFVFFFLPALYFSHLIPYSCREFATENVTREGRASRKARVAASERASFFPTKKCEKCQRFFFFLSLSPPCQSRGGEWSSKWSALLQQRPESAIYLSIYLSRRWRNTTYCYFTTWDK